MNASSPSESRIAPGPRHHMLADGWTVYSNYGIYHTSAHTTHRYRNRTFTPHTRIITVNSALRYYCGSVWIEPYVFMRHFRRPFMLAERPPQGEAYPYVTPSPVLFSQGQTARTQSRHCRTNILCKAVIRPNMYLGSYGKGAVRLCAKSCVQCCALSVRVYRTTAIPSGTSTAIPKR